MCCEITLEEYGNVKFSEIPKAIHDKIMDKLRKSFDVFWDRVCATFEKAKLYEVAQYVDIKEYIVIV